MAPLTPLLRPDRYFAERTLNGLRMLAVVGVATLGILGVYYGIGWVVASHVDGTVLVDNPERPPDWVCEDDSDVYDQSGCDQPRQVERDVDTKIWAAWNGTAAYVLVAVPLAWLLVGVLLHAGSWFADADGGLAASFGVAAWTLLPVLAGGIVILGVLVATFDPVTVTPSNQKAAVTHAITAFRAIGPIQTLTTILTAVWGAVIVRYGLEHWRAVSGLAGWLIGGSVEALLVAVAIT